MRIWTGSPPLAAVLCLIVAILLLPVGTVFGSKLTGSGISTWSRVNFLQKLAFFPVFWNFTMVSRYFYCKCDDVAYTSWCKSGLRCKALLGI